MTRSPVYYTVSHSAISIPKPSILLSHREHCSAVTGVYDKYCIALKGVSDKYCIALKGVSDKYCIALQGVYDKWSHLP
jgi:hypothetical protein